MKFYLLKDVKIIYKNDYGYLKFDKSDEFLVSEGYLVTYRYLPEVDNKTVHLGIAIYIIDCFNRTIPAEEYIKCTTLDILSGKMQLIEGEEDEIEGGIYCYYKLVGEDENNFYQSIKE